MVLVYKFKKEKLDDGNYASRPRILVELSGPDGALMVPALIDTGCDTTVVPEEVAKIIGLRMDGQVSRIYGFLESNEVIIGKSNILFLGKEYRQSVKLRDVPILIVKKTQESGDEGEIILGIEGIFDAFEITFRKNQNKIILKETKTKIGINKQNILN